jgi:hypothetical protein
MLSSIIRRATGYVWGVYIGQTTDTIKSRPSQELLAVQKKVKRMGARCAARIGMSTNSTPSVVVEEGVSFTVCHSSPDQCSRKEAGA